MDAGNALEAAGRFYGSKQGKSELAGQNRAIEDEQAGKWWLDYKERVADLVGGGGSEKWLRPLKNPKGIRTILGEDPEALERHYSYYDPIHTMPAEGQEWWRAQVAASV